MGGRKAWWVPALRRVAGVLGRRRAPSLVGTVPLAGLHGPVEILRDRWGATHIYADTPADLYYAQGYAHAQERLFQMDFVRRLIAGRLAEVLGPAAVDADRWLRTLTLRRVAEQEVGLLDERSYAEVSSYVAGVNAFLQTAPRPVECLLLGYRPEPWSFVDTLAWAKLMAWTLSSNWEVEVVRSLLVRHLGPERAAELEPPYLERWPYVVPSEIDYGQVGDRALEAASAARRYLRATSIDGVGSNNWVLSGERTASGKPLLANDMHLALMAPPVWYENHLVCPEMNVTGVSFPGVPGVVAGHNGHVAWGYTNGYADAQDLYLERLRPGRGGGVRAEYEGEWYDAVVLEETIRVRGGRPRRHRVVITRHGPIINDLAAEAAGEQPMALRWTSLEPASLVPCLLAMNRVRDVHEMRRALAGWTGPVQNVVYADVAGNIAYSLAGRVPVRARGDGSLPVPGWTAAYEWTGYLPPDALPHLLNPPCGYVATANNRVVDDTYPHYIGRDTPGGDRAERICALLAERPMADVATMQAMQMDLVSPSARAISAHLAALRTGDPALEEVLDVLRGWDGRLAADSAAAAIYEVAASEMLRLMLRDKLPVCETPEGEAVDVALRAMGQGPNELLKEHTLYTDRSLQWLQVMLDAPNPYWFDLGHGETREDVMRLALLKTTRRLRRSQGPDPRRWAWGRLHRVRFEHPLSALGAADAAFSRGPYPAGGDSTTIWATGMNRHERATATAVAPPYRMVVDLGDLENSRALLAPGQSGHPGDPHYDDQAEAWFTGEYHPMLYGREAVEEHAEGRLVLRPEG